MSPERPTSVPWPPILLALTGGGALALGRYVPLPWPGVDDMPARLVGMGLGAAGALLIGWALVEFARARANVWPSRAATTLITTGPFRIWRNPLYMGEILLLLGCAELVHNIWFVAAAALFGVAVLALAIIPEERHLEARFGEEYLRYKAVSRRWF